MVAQVRDRIVRGHFEETPSPRLRGLPLARLRYRSFHGPSVAWQRRKPSNGSDFLRSLPQGGDTRSVLAREQLLL